MREVGVFALIDAFNGVLKRAKPELRHRVELDAVSVPTRIMRLVDHLLLAGETRFDELVRLSASRIDIIVTFLAMLEMTKLSLLMIFQSEGGVIYLTPNFEARQQVISKMSLLEDTYAE